MFSRVDFIAVDPTTISGKVQTFLNNLVLFLQIGGATGAILYIITQVVTEGVLSLRGQAFTAGLVLGAWLVICAWLIWVKKIGVIKREAVQEKEKEPNSA